MDNFEVTLSPSVSEIDEDSTLITSVKTWKDIEDQELRVIANSFNTIANKRSDISSVFTNEPTTSGEITIETINTLANGLNTNLSNLLTANGLIVRNVLSNGLVGGAYEAIYANINSDYKLSYDAAASDEISQIKELIETFNKEVDIRKFIREAISGTFLSGNYPAYLRTKKDNAAVIDHYPLEFCYPSDYMSNGESLLEFNVQQLKTLLTKTYKKTKKRKALYFEDVKKEIENNYPPEVVKAYNDGENYVRLDNKYAGCVKINSLGRKFGVSPLFKCLKTLTILDNLKSADVVDSKTRKKVIIFQKLRKELLENNKIGLSHQSFAHEQAAAALKTNMALYTAPPTVESLEYVQKKTSNEDNIKLNEFYTSELLQCLGIGFKDINTSTYAVAKISIEQLLRTVNSIGESTERLIEKFYRALLSDNGYDPSLTPSIQIIDSEQMSSELKQSLSTHVYNTLNASYETAYGMLGIDVKDEAKKKISEQELGYDEIFTPHATAFNSKGTPDDDAKGSPGRPSDSEDDEQKELDKQYTKNVRK